MEFIFFNHIPVLPLEMWTLIIDLHRSSRFRDDCWKWIGGNPYWSHPDKCSLCGVHPAVTIECRICHAHVCRRECTFQILTIQMNLSPPKRKKWRGQCNQFHLGRPFCGSCKQQKLTDILGGTERQLMIPYDIERKGGLWDIVVAWRDINRQ